MPNQEYEMSSSEIKAKFFPHCKVNSKGYIEGIEYDWTASHHSDMESIWKYSHLLKQAFPEAIGVQTGSPGYETYYDMEGMPVTEKDISESAEKYSLTSEEFLLALQILKKFRFGNLDAYNDHREEINSLIEKRHEETGYWYSNNQNLLYAKDLLSIFARAVIAKRETQAK